MGLAKTDGFPLASVEAHINQAWQYYVPEAKAVWNLARKATLEEAARAGGTATRNAFAEASDNLTDQEFDELVAKVPAAIRALSVEG
jgi:hypothetical protein